jgi:hypothetical protein
MEIRNIEVWGQPKVMWPHLNQWLNVCLSSQLHREAKIGVLWSRHTVRPYLKITNAKRAGGLGQVVEHSPSSVRTWGQLPVPPKKKKKWNLVTSHLLFFWLIIITTRWHDPVS